MASKKKNIISEVTTYLQNTTSHRNKKITNAFQDNQCLYCAVYVTVANRKTPSWKENTRIHSNNVTPTLTQSLKNEETSSLYAEKLFKLYDGVETFVMFIGYPRSRHSLVAAILDAHPEIIITDQYDVITHLKKYQSSTHKNLQKYRLFFGIHQLSREEAMFGNHASPGHQLENKQGYYYNVPGSWQGGYEEKIKAS
ncbi:hypothetical protein ACROYT_G025331 [Oculina patagonica]